MKNKTFTRIIDEYKPHVFRDFRRRFIRTQRLDRQLKIEEKNLIREFSYRPETLPKSG